MPCPMSLSPKGCLARKKPSGNVIFWKNPRASAMSSSAFASCPFEARPSTKKTKGKMDSANAVKYRGEMKENSGLVAMDCWMR